MSKPSLLPQSKKRFFGRRIGRPLSPKRQALWDNLLPNIEIDIDLEADKLIHPDSFFDKSFERIELEVGFGNGDMLAALHKENPSTAYIGCEPFMNAAVNLLDLIQDDNNENIRVWNNDAIRFLEKLEGNSLDAIYVLNPDPWPKKRHHKRRIVRTETLDIYAYLLKPGGHMLMTTDVDELAEWMCAETINHSAFEWIAESKKDWETPPKGWLPSKYEIKGAEAGRKQSYLLFKRV